VAASSLAYADDRAPQGAPDDRDTVSEAIHIIESRYGERVDPADLWRAATAGVAAGLDHQLGVRGSAVLTQDQHNLAQAWLRGEREGIGVEFSIAPGQGLLIRDIFADGPGDQAGLAPRDLVVAMDGHPFIGQPAAVIHTLVSRALDHTVVLEVRGLDDRLRRLEVKRGPYNIAQVKPQPDAQEPTVRLPFFGDGTTRSLARALAALPEDAPAIILDLRDNAGGQLDEAIAAADLFLEPGAVVVQLQGPDGRREARTAQGRRVFSGRVVALVNQGTRGAAEGFLAGLRAHGVATLVGTRTGGDVGVPEFHEVGQGLVLQLPAHSLLGPTGESWLSEGISPDVLVEPVQSSLPARPGKLPPDLQQDAAIQLVRAP
jgi:carboxyl-terminal processing protease